MGLQWELVAQSQGERQPCAVEGIRGRAGNFPFPPMTPCLGGSGSGSLSDTTSSAESNIIGYETKQQLVFQLEMNILQGWEKSFSSRLLKRRLPSPLPRAALQATSPSLPTFPLLHLGERLVFQPLSD